MIITQKVVINLKCYRPNRRVFCLDVSVKKHIILKDLDKGLEMYLKNEDSKEKEKDKMREIISSMYV